MAALAGVSARAVRHYHRIGVLPEPGRRANGYREYDLADLVRLLRVRWLHRAGVPLRDIESLIQTAVAVGSEADAAGSDQATSATTSPGDGVADLDALIGAVGAQIDELTERRRRLIDLRAQLVAGRPLDPRSPAVSEALASLAEAAGPELATALDREDLALQAAYLADPGPMDPRAEETLAAMYRRLAADPEALAAVAEVERSLTALSHADPQDQATQAEIERVAEQLVRVLPREVWELASSPEGASGDAGGAYQPAWSSDLSWSADPMASPDLTRRAGTSPSAGRGPTSGPGPSAGRVRNAGTVPSVAPVDWLAALIPTENGQAVVRRAWELRQL